MSLRSDIAADYRYIEGVEDVTFTPQNPSATAVNNVKALFDFRGANPLVTAAAGVDPSDATIHLWIATLGGKVPKNGDLVTRADSTIFNVTSIAESAMASRFMCQARQQV